MSNGLFVIAFVGGMVAVCFLIAAIERLSNKSYTLGFKHGKAGMGRDPEVYRWEINKLRRYKDGYADGSSTRIQEEKEREEFLRELENNN